jgi:hypothetical protein
MHKVLLTVPDVAFIAATRGALGFGVGLLLAGKFSASHRRKIGIGLRGFGLVTTVPAARRLFGARPRPQSLEGDRDG